MKNTKMRNTFRIVLHNPFMQMLYIANRERNRYYIYNEFVNNTLLYFKQVNRRVGLSPGKHTKSFAIFETHSHGKDKLLHEQKKQREEE